MTVPAQPNTRTEAVGNGISTVFAFEFLCLEARDLQVSMDGEVVPPAQYAVSGLGQHQGGAVTFFAAPASGVKILMELAVVADRQNDYQDFGDLFAGTVNFDFDRIWLAIQSAVGNLRRALQLGLYDNDGSGAYRANGNRIQNLGYPQALQDAVSLLAAQDLDNRVREYAEELAAAVSPGAGTGAFQQLGPGAVIRTFQAKMRDIVSVKDFGAIGDGVTSDQAAINAAIAHAYSINATLHWPAGTYLSNANIVGFHNVPHTGDGVILRGISTWHITPAGEQRNVIHISPSGTVDNDGLSRDTGTTLARLNTIVTNTIGSKAANGIWRAQLADGTYTDNGIRLIDWPLFRNPFELWGETPLSDKNTKPLAVWSGLSSTENYALQGTNTSKDLNLSIRYICFEDWQGPNPSSPSGLAGATALWSPGTYEVEYCWFVRASRGFSFRYGYGSARNCRFEDNITHGCSVSYGGTANFGANGNGNVYIRSGVDTGRFSVAYVVDNDFDECDICIQAQYLARMNPQNNRYSNWRIAVYRAFDSLNTEAVSDNNTYLTPITRDKPVWFGTQNSVHNLLHTGPARTTQSYDNARYAISGKSGQRIQLSAEFGTGYTPFRLPGWALYAPDWRMEIELNITIPNGGGGLLEFAGAASAPTAVVASLDIPVQSGGAGDRRVRISLVPAGASQVRGIAEHPGLNLSQAKLTTMTVAHVNNTSNLIVWRLYFTPYSDVEIGFGPFRSWFEG